MPKTAKKSASKKAPAKSGKTKAAKKAAAAKTAARHPAAAAARKTTAAPARATSGRRAGKSGITAVTRPVTHEEIATRAYFIGERRRRIGLAGDAESDWLEAERQLRS